MLHRDNSKILCKEISVWVRQCSGLAQQRKSYNQNVSTLLATAALTLVVATTWRNSQFFAEEEPHDIHNHWGNWTNFSSSFWNNYKIIWTCIHTVSKILQPLKSSCRGENIKMYLFQTSPPPECSVSNSFGRITWRKQCRHLPRKKYYLRYPSMISKFYLRKIIPDFCQIIFHF